MPDFTGADFCQTVGSSKVVSPTITTTASAYTSGDVVGGVLTLSDAMRKVDGTGLLQSISVIDGANQKAALTILLFNANPSAGTYTDNGACPSFVTNSADRAKLIRKINIAGSDYETIGSIAVAEITAISKHVSASGSKHLYAIIVTTGTPTYGANSTDLVVRFGFLRD
jgi:hypothetical protein